jgi:adenosine deaminase
VDRLASSGVGLTVCPISNSYVSDGLKASEVKAMLDRSLRVTVNSDDPAYFPGYVSENLAAVAAAASLSKQELVQLERNAFTIAWITDQEKAAYLSSLAEAGERAGE